MNNMTDSQLSEIGKECLEHFGAELETGKNFVDAGKAIYLILLDMGYIHEGVCNPVYIIEIVKYKLG